MSFTRLRYHVVTTTKYRTLTLELEIETIAYTAMRNKAQSSGGVVIAINGVLDHTHLIVAIKPTVTLSDFMRRMKSAGSAAVNRSGVMQAGFAWQRGYSVFTLDAFRYDGAVDYVLNQKEHHRLGTLIPEFEQFYEDSEEAAQDDS